MTQFLPDKRGIKRPVITQLRNVDRLKAMMLGLPIKKLSYRIPFGYKVDPDNKDRLIPVEEHLKLLRKALVFTWSYSYHKVAEWLTEKSGVKICGKSLHNIIATRYPIPQLTLPYEERLKLYHERQGLAWEAEEEFEEGSSSGPEES